MAAKTVKELLALLRAAQRDDVEVTQEDVRELASILFDIIEESAQADELRRIQQELYDDLARRLNTPAAGSLGPTGGGSGKGSLG